MLLWRIRDGDDLYIDALKTSSEADVWDAVESVAVRLGVSSVRETE